MEPNADMSYLTGKLAELTEGIFSVTQRGDLSWTMGDADGCFKAQIGDLTVILEKITGGDGMPAVALLMCNRAGRLVQRFSDAELSDHDPQETEHRTFWELLGELYEMARWSAEGLFDLIDSAMETLSPPEAEEDNKSRPAHDEEYGWSSGSSRRLQTSSALSRRSVA